jgi:hypothetical protein
LIHSLLNNTVQVLQTLYTVMGTQTLSRYGYVFTLAVLPVRSHKPVENVTILYLAGQK